MSIGGATPLVGPLPTVSPVHLPRHRPPHRALGVILAEAEMTDVATFDFMGGRAVAFTTRAPQKESPNEDVAALLPAGPAAGLLAVADGLGGHAGGERASRLTIQALQQSLQLAQIPSDSAEGDLLRGAILNGIESANRQVRELGSGAATTLAVVEIQDRLVRSYHVGDSVILLTGQRGKLKLQTIAHSPIGYAVEAGLINEEDAIHHDERHVISNVIGSDEMRIEIGPAVEMAPRDTLLLASDGLVDNLLPGEIVDFIRTGPLERAVQALVDETLRRMTATDPRGPSKPDDLTVIAYRPS